MEQKLEKEVNINIITLGDQYVGKTSIINRIKYQKFQDHLNSTIGIQLLTIKRKYEKKNIMILLNFKDTAGQEIFSSMPLQYIRNSHIVLLVFSDIETLNSLKERWYTFYKAHANIENSKFILIGNKSDIFGNEKEEIIRQGQEFAEEIDAHFITCSAKSADNMDNVENFIISEAKRFIDEALEILREINNNKQINLNKKNANRNNDCNC